LTAQQNIQAEIRRALPGDRRAVTETVASAFARDPAWTFLLGERYRQLAPEFAGALFDQRVGAGSVWISAELTAVAMWDRPGGAAERTPQTERDAWTAFNQLADSGARARLAAYDAAIHRARPQRPHWYLGVLATHPAHRRKGLASAVLEPALKTASAEQAACFLETSTDSNRRFYERRGFQVEKDITAPGAPQVWWMRRPAQTART
jgi:GNAT superfamily N-acetyltransferase